MQHHEARRGRSHSSTASDGVAASWPNSATDTKGNSPQPIHRARYAPHESGKRFRAWAVDGQRGGRIPILRDPGLALLTGGVRAPRRGQVREFLDRSGFHRHRREARQRRGGRLLHAQEGRTYDAELTTTEVYTRGAIVKLKEVHEATHPARLQARGAAHGGMVGASGVGVRAALLDALDAEAMHQPD